MVHGDEKSDEDEVEPVADIEMEQPEKDSMGGHNKLIASTYMEPMVILGFVLTACICIVCWMRFTDNKRAAAVEHALQQEPMAATPLMDTIDVNTAYTTMKWSENVDGSRIYQGL